MSAVSLFDSTDRGALLSEDGCYRYRLWRRWADGPLMGFIMLNPSTADADVDDPTIRRCIGFARREGCAGIEVRNLFAYRTPKPAVLAAAASVGVDVVGPDNDDQLVAFTNDRFGVRPLVAAWGAGPSGVRFRPLMVARVRLVTSASDRLLRFVRDGGTSAPHPLYLPADLPLAPYSEVPA